MAKFNVGDKVTILNGSPLWFNKEGIVKEADEEGNVLVKIHFEDLDGEDKTITNLFSEEDLGISTEHESLIGESTMNQLKLTEEELQQWMDDNDANYWDQEVTDDNKVEIRGIHEVLGTYDFNEGILTLNEGYLDAEADTFNTEVEVSKDKSEEDFIKDYVTFEDIDGKKHPSWYFINKIATAENVEFDVVYTCAHKFKYKIFHICAGPTFSQAVVADKEITKQDIYDEYADYLQGPVTIYEEK